MGTAVASAAAVAAVVSAVFVWLQVREMRKQTALQRELSESSAQPYIWADVRVSSANGWTLHFIIGNSGPTVATDVRVTIDPQLPAGSMNFDVVQKKLANGIASLAPGRELDWVLGPAPELVNAPGPQAYTVRLACNGPFGAVPASEYILDFDDLAETVANREGTKHQIAEAVDGLTNQLKS